MCGAQPPRKLLLNEAAAHRWLSGFLAPVLGFSVWIIRAL